MPQAPSTSTVIVSFPLRERASRATLLNRGRVPDTQATMDTESELALT